MRGWQTKGDVSLGSWSPKAKKLARQVFKRVSVKAMPEPRGSAYPLCGVVRRSLKAKKLARQVFRRVPVKAMLEPHPATPRLIFPTTPGSHEPAASNPPAQWPSWPRLRERFSGRGRHRGGLRLQGRSLYTCPLRPQKLSSGSGKCLERA